MSWPAFASMKWKGHDDYVHACRPSDTTRESKLSGYRRGGAGGTADEIYRRTPEHQARFAALLSKYQGATQ